MLREALLSSALGSGALLLGVWLVLRLAPRVSAGARAWVWRLAFLKPILGLVPLAAITLRVLPASPAFSGPALPTAMAATTAVVPVAATPDEPPGLDPWVAAWAAGVVLVAARGSVRLAQTALVARRACPVTDGPASDALEALRLRAGVEGSIRLAHAPEIESPTLLVGRRATILLPSAAFAESPETDLRLMLAHEVAHVVRRDPFWFAETWAVQAIFFFSPVVWLASYRCRLDHESATDRLACQLAGVPVRAYAQMLVRATVAARPTLVPGVLPMAESYRTVHRRLEAMKHFETKPSRPRRAALGALALATACLLPSYRLAAAQGHSSASSSRSKGGSSKATSSASASGRAGGSGKGVQSSSGSLSVSTDSSGTKVGFKFENYDAKEALQGLFKQTGKKLRIEPGLNRKITATTNDASFETALRTLLKAANATSREENGTVVVSPKPKA